ncbi:chalcone isomerase family protein [Hydrogenophaga sp. 5NK40-0174]|uniref:chalcone isomerase family protein n=1 Tax=Hydrogenophaga sp. 5NK40-0174 TaxID=3127649 RepID=UPI00334102B1
MVCLVTMLASVSSSLLAKEATAETPQAATAATTPVEWPVRGRTLFKVWGFEIYFATLKAPPGFVPDLYAETPFSLTLEYRRSFTGVDIARRSIEEMQKQSALSEEEAKRWGLQLQQLFPDVAKGDSITGRYVPGKGADFTLNGRALGRIDDPALAQRFFAIWLSPRTSEPEMRQALIGPKGNGR